MNEKSVLKHNFPKIRKISQDEGNMENIVEKINLETI